jgi:hypothetical protein
MQQTQYDPRTLSAKNLFQYLGSNTETHHPYPTNPESIAEIKRRLVATAKKRGLVTYSDLVRGIKFVHPERGTEPFEIFTPDWKGWERKFIGAILAQTTCETALETGCVITSIVVDAGENAPSKILFEWLAEIGVIPDTDEMTVLSFWAHHVKQTHEYFKTHDKI